MAIVLAFTGLRWEEAVAVLIDSVNLERQCIALGTPCVQCMPLHSSGGCQVFSRRPAGAKR